MIIKKLIFLFCLLLSMSIYSQNSLEEMKEPYVKVVENKFVVENYTLYTDKINSNSLQVKVKAETPKDLMHRDYFVGLVTATELLVLYPILDEVKINIEKMKQKTLKKPIGQVDIEIRLIFTKEGMQMSLIGPSRERINQTVTWKEIFEQ